MVAYSQYYDSADEDGERDLTLTVGLDEPNELEENSPPNFPFASIDLLNLD